MSSISTSTWEIIRQERTNRFSFYVLSGSLHSKVLSNNDGDGGATATKTHHLKSEFTPAASNFIALIPSRLIHQMLANCLELNSKGLYQSSGKEKESCCLRFPSLTKPEIKHFHVVVVQWRQRNVQKSVMHVLSFCFDTINLLLCSLIFTVKNSARSCYVTGWKKHSDLASTRFRVHEFHSEERIQKVSDLDSSDTYQ